MSTGIQISEMSRSYGEIQALDTLSIDIRQGEIFGLIGPDGAGKTTLMKILCGLIKPDSGTYKIGRYSGKTDGHLIKSMIGYMPQKFSLYPDLTVMENLRFFADLLGVTGREFKKRETRLFEFSRLDPFRKRKAGALSGGMKQKLALSCALIHQPGLLILDEPTTGVDPLSRREFWDILKELNDHEKTTILVSTPYMDEAMMCHRIGFLLGGRLLAMDSPSGMLATYPEKILQLEGDSLLGIKTLCTQNPDISSVYMQGDILRLSTLNTDPIVHWIESQTTLRYSIEISNPQLQDVFIYFMGQATRV